jgi:signal transduction histidine kinase
LNKVLEEFGSKIEETKARIDTDKLPVITGYPFLLTLLFYHIIDNALKFRDPENKPHVRIVHDIIEKPTGNLHRISIHDNGIGFSQDEADKVFLMFYRLHDKNYKGSGIGLAICRKITELHGGTIATESEPGKGTMVCCFFPVQ